MIQHRRGYQRFVGHDRLDSIEAADHDIARRDLADDPEAIVDRDHVANADRSVEQDREAGDVVAREFLQPEADAHADGTAEYRQHGQIDADKRKRNEDADKNQYRAEQLRQNDAQVAVEMRDSHEALFDQAGDPQRQYEHDDDCQSVASEVEQADFDPADRQPSLLEGRADLRAGWAAGW